MSQGRRKILLALEVLVLLLPLTLFMTLLVPLSYIAYPVPDPKLIQIVFDLAMLIKLAGIIAAWRLAVSYISGGRRSLQSAHPIWICVLAAAAVIGLLSTLVAVEQMTLAEYPSERIGFTLLAPALALMPIAVHMFLESRFG